MIQSINHVTYSVSDISKSIVFYKDILKAEFLLDAEKNHLFYRSRRSQVRTTYWYITR